MDTTSGMYSQLLQYRQQQQQQQQYQQQQRVKEESTPKLELMKSMCDADPQFRVIYCWKAYFIDGI